MCAHHAHEITGGLADACVTPSLADPARDDEAPRRHCCPGSEYRAGVCANSAEQRCAGHGDRLDIARLPGGRRPPAVDRPAGRGHCTDGCAAGDLGDLRRREVAGPLLVAECEGSLMELVASLNEVTDAFSNED